VRVYLRNRPGTSRCSALCGDMRIGNDMPDEKQDRSGRQAAAFRNLRLDSDNSSIEPPQNPGPK